jgi:hypothetical protein
VHLFATLRTEPELKARHHFPAEPNINRHEAAPRSSGLEQDPLWLSDPGCGALSFKNGIDIPFY